MSVMLRLIRACALAGMTLRETVGVIRAVRRGEWQARTVRELRAQAEYLRLLAAQERKA
jgi:hypothetical protein